MSESHFVIALDVYAAHFHLLRDQARIQELQNVGYSAEQLLVLIVYLQSAQRSRYQMRVNGLSHS